MYRFIEVKLKLGDEGENAIKPELRQKKNRRRSVKDEQGIGEERLKGTGRASYDIQRIRVRDRVLFTLHYSEG